MNEKILENKLRTAISIVQNQEYTIAQGPFIVEEKKTCCPLGALCLLENETKPGERFMMLIDKLHLSIKEIWAFKHGFENNKNEDYHSSYQIDVKPYYDLGVKFRKEFVKRKLSEIIKKAAIRFALITKLYLKDIKNIILDSFNQ